MRDKHRFKSEATSTRTPSRWIWYLDTFLLTDLGSTTKAVMPWNSDDAVLVWLLICGFLLCSLEPQPPLVKTAVKVKVEPTLGMLAKPISPFMRPTRHLLMLRPIPVPPCVREMDGPTCINGVKTRDCASGGIPAPVSSTETMRLIWSEDDEDKLLIDPSWLKALNPLQLFRLSATGKPLKVSFDDDVSVWTSIESITSSTRWTVTRMCPLSVNCKLSQTA